MDRENNVGERTIAAYSFRDYMADEIKKNPCAAHIILAHSHGGTVASESLSLMKNDPRDFSGIKGLICLSTPFVYITGAPGWQFTFAFVSFFFLLLTLLVNSAALLTGMFGFEFSLWKFALFAIVFFAILSLFLIPSVAATGSYSAGPRTGEIGIPVYLLRATRDEASLALGLAQIVAWLTLWFALANDPPKGKSRKFYSRIRYVCAIGVSYYAAYQIAKPLTGYMRLDASGSWISAFSWLNTFAVAGAVYFAGYALLALWVGHTSVRTWLRTVIEVETAPPGIFCKLKIYGLANSTTARISRHSLYENEEVQKDIGAIVAELSERPRR